jgi:hypothetical protein
LRLARTVGYGPLFDIVGAVVIVLVWGSQGHARTEQLD